MLHKSARMSVANRRSVTQFFNRVSDQFERKFDGFPALVAPPNVTPGIQEEAYEDVDYGDILDEIAKKWIDAEGTPQCVDLTEAEAGECVGGDCSGRPYTEELTYSSGEWVPSLDVDYYIEVWVDGLKMVSGIDWNNCSGNVCLVNDDPLAIVTARYVVL